jgi:hypothetical protein
MAEVPRITAELARSKTLSRSAILVCAYEDPESYKSLNLEGSISLQRLRELLPTLDRGQEIVCYCA